MQTEAAAPHDLVHHTYGMMAEFDVLFTGDLLHFATDLSDATVFDVVKNFYCQKPAAIGNLQTLKLKPSDFEVFKVKKPPTSKQARKKLQAFKKYVRDEKQHPRDVLLRSQLLSEIASPYDFKDKCLLVITVRYVTEKPKRQEDVSAEAFYNGTVQELLHNAGYEIHYICCVNPKVAVIELCKISETTGCMQFIQDDPTSLEVEIFIWPVPGGTLIVMRAVGHRLTYFKTLDLHLWSVMRQLLEAVRFMHDHQVAHLDLKPPNILLPLYSGEDARLTIIDFGVSVCFTDAEELGVSGRVGTVGYMAPEVENNQRYSPMRADLWSMGRVVEEVCSGCSPSPARDFFVYWAQQLMQDNPRMRPTISEVQQAMLIHENATHETPSAQAIQTS